MLARGMPEGITGAVKLKDGLFFGDEFAAQDLEFVVANKVTRIVNCAGRQVGAPFESIGVEYLVFPWVDNDSQVILDLRNQVVSDVTYFIDQALDKGESVLVHSLRGQSRCVTILTAYLMKKYRWTLNKALQYVQSRRDDIALKPAFHRQLLSFERRLGMAYELSSGWDVPPSPSSEHDDLILFNTYLNSQHPARPSHPISTYGEKPNPTGYKRIVWGDHHTGDPSTLERDSDATGQTYMSHWGKKPKSILKTTHHIHLPSASPASTAASTPQLSAAPMPRPSTPQRDVLSSSHRDTPSQREALLPARSSTPLRATPSLVRAPSPVSKSYVTTSSQRSPSPTVFRAPITAVNGLSSSFSAFRSGQPASGPLRVGRPLTTTNQAPASVNFPLRTPVVTNHHVRPPSPMIQRNQPTATAAFRNPSPMQRRPQSAASIRPPSPVRADRDPPPRATLAYSALSGPKVSQPMSELGRTLLASKRAPSPMSAALQLRPLSAPQWRSR